MMTSLPLVTPHNIPLELQAIPQWIGYALHPRANGKADKIPKNPHTDGNAKVNDPHTWGTFEQALELVKSKPHIDGVALVLTADDSVVGIDIDDCIDDNGVPTSQAQTIIDQLHSYTEISPSGSGIRIFVWGSLPPGRRKHTAMGVEMYDTKRFLTVTGHHLPQTPSTVKERTTELCQVHTQLFPSPKMLATQPSLCSTAEPRISQTDEELWQKIFNRKNGDTFRRLFDGDIAVCNNDASLAVIQLGNELAFWTDKDPVRMERMLRQTNLSRAKWEHPRGEITWLQYQIRDCCRFVINTHADGYRSSSHEEVTERDPLTEIQQQVAAPLQLLNGADINSETFHKFTKEGADDEGNAQCVNHLYGERFLYCPAYGWLEYTGTHWRDSQLSESRLNLAITNTLSMRRMVAVQTENESVIKETKRTSQRKQAVKSQLQDLLIVDVDEFDTQPHLLNCKNGIVDLRSGQLITHEPSNRFTYCVDTEYLPNADETVWTQFLATVVGDFSAIAEWLQMACGYSSTGYTNEEIMFYLHGPTRSGKGTFTTALLELLGQPLSRGINFNTFTTRRDGDTQNFDLAPLKPCRFIAASESNVYQRMNEAVVKQITGNDPITASFKHKDQFTFVPRFKIWLSSNHPVKANEDDDAFWGRVKVIHFPNSFLGQEDKTLKNRVKQPLFQQAILAWLVRGAQMWYHEAHGLRTPHQVHTWTQQHRAELDTIQKWLDECTEAQPAGKTVNHLLYISYQNWCKDNGHTPKLNNNFGRILASKGFAQCRMKVGGKTHRGYRGLVLID